MRNESATVHSTEPRCITRLGPCSDDEVESVERRSDRSVTSRRYAYSNTVVLRQLGRYRCGIPRDGITFVRRRPRDSAVGDAAPAGW